MASPAGITDTFVIIQAVDSHDVYDYATMNTTLSAGHTQSEQHHALLEGLAPYGIVKGAAPDFDATRFPRGKTYFGMTRDAADNLAGQCRASWRYINGQLVMVPEDNYVQEAIVLNSKYYGPYRYAAANHHGGCQRSLSYQP